jgi:hypothetical protein
MLSGNIEKMVTQLAAPVEYRLPIGDERLAMNPFLGRALTLRYSGAIHCIACGAKTRKSFSQGFCYRCTMQLAQCDMCILKPETCHYHLGTCREPKWGAQHCMIPHYVYLANSSGLKVGITRTTQVPTRWIDQGATQALPILKTQTRYQSGLVEMACKTFVSDRTHWQAMLKGQAEDIDLTAQRDRLLPQIEGDIAAINDRFGTEVVERVQAPVVEIAYPVLHYPDKIRSFNLDKNPEVKGILQGIKGQYLIFDTGVINLRKYTGYHLCITLGSGLSM